MTTWTEAQIDRHLHLWEHRHGPDSPEAGIVRQLRAERDKARGLLERATHNVPEFYTLWHADSRAALPTTQEKAKCSEND